MTKIISLKVYDLFTTPVDIHGGLIRIPRIIVVDSTHTFSKVFCSHDPWSGSVTTQQNTLEKGKFKSLGEECISRNDTMITVKKSMKKTRKIGANNFGQLILG